MASIFSITMSKAGWWVPNRSADDPLCGASGSEIIVWRYQSLTRRAKWAPIRSVIRPCIMSSGATPLGCN